MLQYKKYINFLGRCNVYRTCFCYTESCKDGFRQIENTDTGQLCIVGRLNTSSLCNSTSKLNMDCNIFKEACTSSKLIMKLLIKSLIGKIYTDIGISIGSPSNHCKLNISRVVLCPQESIYLIVSQCSSNSRDMVIPEWWTLHPVSAKHSPVNGYRESGVHSFIPSDGQVVALVLLKR